MALFYEQRPNEFGLAIYVMIFIIKYSVSPMSWLSFELASLPLLFVNGLSWRPSWLLAKLLLLLYRSIVCQHSLLGNLEAVHSTDASLYKPQCAFCDSLLIHVQRAIRLPGLAEPISAPLLGCKCSHVRRSFSPVAFLKLILPELLAFQ